jgi:outer membrane immunogenic protein
VKTNAKIEPMDDDEFMKLFQMGVCFISMVLVAGIFFAGFTAHSAKASDLGGYKDTPADQSVSYAPFNWSGVYVGAGVGGDLVAVSLPQAYSLGVSKESGFFEGSLTGRFQFPHSPLVLGLRGELSYAPMFKEAGYTGGVEIGYAFGNILPYGVIEYRGQGVPSDWITSGGSSKTYNGFGLGAGIDFAFSTRAVLGVQYVRTDWNTPDLGGLTTNTIEDRGMVELKIKMY